MGSFEENLWSDLVDEHGSALATAERTVQPTKRRAVPLTLGAFGVAAVAAVAFTATGGVGAPPAFAVEVQSNGDVEVTFTQVAGLDGANARLAELGVRAKAVVTDPNCTSTVTGDTVVIGGAGAPTDLVGSRFLIQPSSIPQGSTLLLVAERINPDQVAVTTAMVDDPAPTCVLPQKH